MFVYSYHFRNSHYIQNCFFHSVGSICSCFDNYNLLKRNYLMWTQIYFLRVISGYVLVIVVRSVSFEGDFYLKYLIKKKVTLYTIHYLMNSLFYDKSRILALKCDHLNLRIVLCSRVILELYYALWRYSYQCKFLQICNIIWISNIWFKRMPNLIPYNKSFC